MTYYSYLLERQLGGGFWPSRGGANGIRSTVTKVLQHLVIR